MHNQIIAWATPVFLLLIFAEWWYSRRHALQLYRLNDSLSSLGCGVFTLLVELFAKSALLVLFAWVSQHAGMFEFSSSSWITWVLFFFLFDFVYYWCHRWAHEINFMWGGHVPHHQSEEFNLTTALRQGALQDIFMWPIFLSLALLGCPADVFIVTMTISKLYQFWIHTRVIDKVPFIEGILNTPSAHRVHHGINDIYLDRNHGGTFMIWDRLFGTWQEETETPIYGVRKRYQSWNPVWAHFEWLWLLWQDALKSTDPRDLVRIWFKPTGWRPENVAQESPYPVPDLQHYRRFDSRVDATRQWLAVAAFGVALYANDVLLKNIATLSAWQILLAGAVVVVGLLACARLLGEPTLWRD
ncbi:MAG: sterol desaturase family protein [Pseudomonadota bacterium]